MQAQAHAEVRQDRRRGDDVFSRWVCFEIGGQVFGLPILQVQEVIAAALIEPVPGTEPMVLGVINLRGNVVTVIDLRRRLGLAAREGKAESPIIVVHHDTESVGLQVDSIRDVRKVASGAIKPAPDAGAAAQACAVQGIVSRDHTLLTLLDASPLVRESKLLPDE